MGTFPSSHIQVPRYKKNGFSNFELLLLVRNSSYEAQILRGISYNVVSTFITKFETTGLFILILYVSAIVHE